MDFIKSSTTAMKETSIPMNKLFKSMNKMSPTRISTPPSINHRKTFKQRTSKDSKFNSYRNFLPWIASCQRSSSSSLSSSSIILMRVLAIISYVIIATSFLPSVASEPPCPTGCVCNNQALEVNCTDGRLEIIPVVLNPLLQRLVITRNKKIKTFQETMPFLPELTLLDLSHNDFDAIPAGTFQAQKKLKELKLNHNKISHVNNRTFQGLTALIALNLRGNLLTELERSTFTTIPSIEELNLGENRISSIDAHTFDGLINLRVLYLDDNTLTSVPGTVMYASMPSLGELYLGTNSFENLPPRIFSNIKGLQRLDLKGAGLIHNISAMAFDGLGNLRSLDLSDNRLLEIPTEALSNLTRLEELYLGQNDFEFIPSDAFGGLKNLRRLEISGSMRLQSIQSGAFANNTNLECLNITGNKQLAIIEAEAFRGLPHLRQVILRENKLKTLEEGLVAWNDLELLDLRDNSFICDCRLMWLHNLLNSNNQKDNSNATNQSLNFEVATLASHQIPDILCSLPDNSKQTSLQQISPTMLGCSSVKASNQGFISVLIVVVTVVVSALILMIYGCRRRIRDLLKGNWGNSALGRKEREYQKTFSDEEYMTRNNLQQQQQQFPCLGLGIQPASGSFSPYTNDEHTMIGQQYHLPNHHLHHPQQSLHSTQYMGGQSRPIPVTEL